MNHFALHSYIGTKLPMLHLAQKKKKNQSPAYIYSFHSFQECFTINTV